MTNHPKAPQLFYKICQKVGSEIPFWTQGTGGNVSVKTKDFVWIKASGKRLDEVFLEGATACVSSRLKLQVKKLLLDENVKDANEHEISYSNLLKQESLFPEIFGRASMETGFHVILERPIVAHFHSLAAIMMCKDVTEGKISLKELIPENVTCRMISFIMPGLQLVKEIATHIDADIYLLENHGVILHGNDETIFDVWNKIETRFIQAKNMEILFQMSLATLIDQLKPTPFKIYFPDAIIYKDKILPLLEEVEAGSYLPAKKSLLKNHRNEIEMWVAIWVLNSLVPDLCEIPEQIQQSMVMLPTEKFRQGKN